MNKTTADVWRGARWIWRQGGAGSDEYVDFLCRFDGVAIGDWRLNISADSDYNVYINGVMAAFGQYADYPARKVYDSVPVTQYIRAGANRMVVRVWHYGVDSQTYVRGEAGLIFSLERDGESVCTSSAATLSRLSHDYVSGRCHSITPQLGLTFCYDSTRDDGYLLDCDSDFTLSAEQTERALPEMLRPIEKLRLDDRLPYRIVSLGAYRVCGSDARASLATHDSDGAVVSETPSDRHTAAERMRDARLLPGCVEISGGRMLRPDGADGIYVVVDVGVETAGFLTLELTVPTSTRIDIGYGEHLRGGVCPAVIGKRNFCAEYIASPGRNSYMNAYRRFGGRYFQIFVPAAWLTLEYLGISPTIYPVRDRGARPADPRRRRIYDVCVNTLRQCMHEHYEDCPWREQALYTMDSRNQMLCGYYAFGEYAFPRASLELISQGVRSDGLLSLCYPAGLDYPIPAFSLVYFIQMREYAEYSGDLTLARQLYPVLSRLMRTFTDRVTEEGLVPNFGGLWNFYEWSRGMSGARETENRTEAPLNALLVLALESLAAICERLSDGAAGLRAVAQDGGKREIAADSADTPCADARLWREIAAGVRRAVKTHFYDEIAGLFRTSRESGEFSVLTNALCLLCGTADDVDKSHILKIVADNGGEILQNVTCDSQTPAKVTPATLSMNCFRFDALLREDRCRYGVHILAELDRVYGYMLDMGATSFWETINGAADFGGAGSLCHGWSALPIYYYSVLDSSMTFGGKL